MYFEELKIESALTCHRQRKRFNNSNSNIIIIITAADDFLLLAYIEHLWEIRPGSSGCAGLSWLMYNKIEELNGKELESKQTAYDST